MKQRVAFISYDVKLSESERVRFCNELGSCSQPFRIDDWSTEPRSPREDWEKQVHGQIGRCDFMIVLVAEGMNLAPISAQIAEARRCNVPFFGVYVDGTNAGVPLPERLGANRTISWDWAKISAAVDQVSREGKHHTFK